ncbi:hypothetical protein ACMT2G_000776 [Campylobacter jejuni]
MTDHNKAIDDLNSRQKGFMATRNAPNDVKSEGLAEFKKQQMQLSIKQELLSKKEMKKSMILINNNTLSLVLTRLSGLCYSA